MRSAYHLASVERVMQVLNCFTVETPELRLTDLSERLGLHKTQVLRIASTLESGGYLTRDPETKRYRLGLQVFRLGMVVRHHMDLRRAAAPFLEWLVEQTQETARLVVPDEAGPVCIDLIESPRGVRVYAQLGARMPWNAGTSAKVILAHLPEHEREQVLARGGFTRFTERTLVDPDQLRAQLCEIRQRGYHATVGDLTEDTQGIAAPLFDDSGAIVGAVSLTAPTTRVTDEERARYIELVIQAAKQISAQLGYQASVVHV